MIFKAKIYDYCSSTTSKTIPLTLKNKVRGSQQKASLHFFCVLEELLLSEKWKVEVLCDWM
jgi:hypothetical protein